MICLTPRLWHDFKAIRALLITGMAVATAWTCPIGVLIPRESTFMLFFSDASHEGLGSWCPQLNLMWCIMKAKLHSLGFVMATHSEPVPSNPPDIVHINVLEFFALSMNVWFALATCHTCDLRHCQHHVGNFFADNTSALSWMVHASQAK